MRCGHRGASNEFESEVVSFLEGPHGDRTHHNQQADHHAVTLLPSERLYTMSPLPTRRPSTPRMLAIL